MILVLSVAVLLFGVAILLAVSGVLRELFRSSIFQPPDMPDPLRKRGDESA
jgi:hypothetical protein